jgi:hypothetical protein
VDCTAHLPNVSIDLFADGKRVLVFCASTTCLAKSIPVSFGLRGESPVELLTRREAAGGHRLPVRG